MATMKDVAELAGVSLGTVSRVINKAQGIKPQTLEKVNAAIEKLNYIPDQYARGMKLNRTNTVALIVPTIWHPFYSEYAYYVEQELTRLDYKMLLCNSAGPEKEAEYIKMLQQNKVDGIIAITYSSIEEFLSSGIPFVSFDRIYPGMDIASVASDNERGGIIAATKLIEKGCTHFGFVGSHNETENETKKRRQFFEKTVLEAGYQISVLDLIEPFNDLKGSIKEFLLENPTIDGIFAINDFTALDVMSVANELGISIPEDLQIIGYDGIKFAQDREYVVSTITQPLEEMAKKGVELVLDIINKREHKRQIIIPGNYVEGKTTKK
ncbi:LacI family DNA-binding transcriptional regulator [Globicatella sulfidifaciens]|uniref:LacI family DNA-binding transcriptional regulator n=1 Tax=Globicatella sulfidifaciens TaxID=136093 RepID=UPI00288C8B56|nr:LacI family DNA-binding transcriptional regulator [Globicatella sulfidifaciens]MDT2769028.1 LacI family DNA-binding transcriptional regulator [Globicatella sulfidifaciens]